MTIKWSKIHWKLVEWEHILSAKNKPIHSYAYKEKKPKAKSIMSDNTTCCNTQNAMKHSKLSVAKWQSQDKKPTNPLTHQKYFEDARRRRTVLAKPKFTLLRCKELKHDNKLATSMTS